jgi:hypothetical protein
VGDMLCKLPWLRPLSEERSLGIILDCYFSVSIYELDVAQNTNVIRTE